MKLLILFLFPSVIFGQSLSNTSRIIYKAQATEVIRANFTPLIEGSPVYVKSTQQVYDEGVELVGLRVLDIPLDSGEVIIAKGANIVYQLTKNGAIVHYVPTTDNSLNNIKTLAQSAVGIAIGSLTTNQVRALLAVLLWKAGGIDESGRVKKLNTWAK
jgi:hypothetical protein